MQQRHSGKHKQQCRGSPPLPAPRRKLPPPHARTRAHQRRGELTEGRKAGRDAQDATQPRWAHPAAAQCPARVTAPPGGQLEPASPPIPPEPPPCSHATCECPSRDTIRGTYSSADQRHRSNMCVVPHAANRRTFDPRAASPATAGNVPSTGSQRALPRLRKAHSDAYILSNARTTSQT